MSDYDDKRNIISTAKGEPTVIHYFTTIMVVESKGQMSVDAANMKFSACIRRRRIHCYISNQIPMSWSFDRYLNLLASTQNLSFTLLMRPH